jgi:hypothetical protein
MIQVTGAEVINREISKTYTYSKTNILTLSIRFPEIRAAQSAASLISRHYRRVAQLYYTDVSARLYTGAVKEWKETQEDGFPFRPYDAVMDYQVTLNESCHFSTYTDRYEFTGGAHGSTVRTSDNWNIKTGKRVHLKDLFPREENIRRKIIDLL